MIQTLPTFLRRRNLTCLFLFLFLFFPFNVHASKLAWLNIDPNVRSAAMGGCGVAFDIDPDAVAINPALLSWLQGPELCLMHNQWFDDSTLEHISFGQPLPRNCGAALLLDYANFGDVQGTRVGSDGYVYPSGTYQPHGIRIGGGFGKHWGVLGFGAALHGNFENGFGVNQSSLSWGTGLAYRPQTGPLSAGFFAQSSLGQASGEARRVEFRPGLAAHFGNDARSSVLGTLEGALGGENPKVSLKLGGEYAYLSKYFVRCGYRWYNDSSELAGFRGLTMGLGFKSDLWSLHYALTTLGSLGTGHQFSIVVHFPHPETKTANHKYSQKSAITVKAPAHDTSAATMTEKTRASESAPKPTPTLGTDHSTASTADKMMDWYQKGMSAYKKKEYILAVQHLEKAASLQDATVKDFYYAEAYATLGAIYQYRLQDEGHLDQARKYYTKALQIDPDTETAKNGMKQLDEDKIH